MKLSYREALVADVSKLNAKFDKFIVDYMAEVSVVKRTGYYQDFRTVVACYVGEIDFCSNGRYVRNSFERDFALNIDGVSITATLSLELSGNRFVESEYNGAVFVKKEEIKKVFDKIDEDTYWPNGYGVGEYDAGGHDYYVSGKLKRVAQKVLETYDGKPIIEAKNKKQLRELAQGEAPYVVRVKGKQVKRNAFCDDRSVSTLILEDTEKIGNFAFYGCNALTKVMLPPTLKEIGKSAFAECCSLTEIEIPDSVTQIDAYAFQYCYMLKRISVKAAALLSEANLMEDVQIVERG